MHSKSRQVALAVSSILSLSSAAWVTQSAVAAEEEAVLQEVVVTGSRIVRRDYSSQSPIVTVGADAFEERANIGIESALNQLPQFSAAGSGTQSSLSTASTPFPGADAAPGAATANLRGLGTKRTLVLVNGRRVQPVNGTLTVDLNTIPAAAINNVEIITGGAAAVYGADAIAGVVNLILKKDFQGAEFSAQYGMSQKGDGQELQLSSLIGANFSDGRGNVMLGINYADRKQIFGKDRDYVTKGWDDPKTAGGSLNNSNLTQFAAGAGNSSLGGFTLINNGTNYGVDQNGKVFDPQDPLNSAHPYTGPMGGTSGFKVNPDGTLGYNDRVNNFLQVPLERYALFGSTIFNLTDTVTLFSDVHFSETKAEAPGFVSALFNIWSPTVPYNSLYDDPAKATFGQAAVLHPVPAQLAAVLNARTNPNAPWTYQGGLDYLPNYTTNTTSNVFQVVAGLRGSVPGTQGWTWEVYGSHGKSSVNAQQPDGFPYLPRIQNLFNANQYGKGYAVGFPIAITGTCTSGLPIFNRDGSVNNTPSTSQDCADYTVLRFNSISTLTQEVAEATVQGSLFKLPAGDVQFAAGVDYRAESFRFDPDSGFNANQDFPNVVQNIILPVTVDGRTNVKEVYAEFAIPILKDLPFIKRLELDPGIRSSKYSTSGNNETFKLLGDWEVNDAVRFRGGVQRANRAPNVTELFTPRGGSQLRTGVDSCANYVPQTPIWGNVAGNPNRLNLQILCQYLMTRDGAPASLYVPGTASANNYTTNALGLNFYFPFVIGVTEGNRNLDSEKADTTTIGVVLKSPFEAAALQRLTLSVDYYKIDITGAIDTPDHATIYSQCLNAQYNSLLADTPGSHTGAELAANNPFCALIQREYIPGGPSATGADRKYKAQYLNQGGIKTSGVDLQLDWAANFADVGMSAIPGMFNLNIQYSKLDKYAVSPFPGAAFTDYAGTVVNSSFNYKLFTTLGYSTGPVTGGLRWQHLPGVARDPLGGTDAFPVDSHDQFDLYGRWAVNKRYEVRGGIDNMFDAQPEVVGASSTNASQGTTSVNYDTIGRRFYFAVTAKF
jgi:iron complex outermembrane recepter protein